MRHSGRRKRWKGGLRCLRLKRLVDGTLLLRDHLLRLGEVDIAIPALEAVGNRSDLGTTFRSGRSPR